MVSGEEEIELRKGILAPPKSYSGMYHIVELQSSNPSGMITKPVLLNTSRHGCKLYLGSLYIYVVGHHTSQLN